MFPYHGGQMVLITLGVVATAGVTWVLMGLLTMFIEHKLGWNNISRPRPRHRMLEVIMGVIELPCLIIGAVVMSRSEPVQTQ